MNSPRTIDSIRYIGNATAQVANYGDSATVAVNRIETSLTENFVIRYRLNSSQLGLFSYSTALSDSLVPDSLGRGYFTFIAEPAQDSAITTIQKVFTLMIDRSGSMTGTKMQQAKDAAAFIVNNLNAGDRFNLIDFDDVITSFRPTHVNFTPQTRDSALAYIGQLDARNLTNISGAFATAIPQFSTSSDSVANIIVFLTDGQPTAGITNTNALVARVDSLVNLIEMNLTIFSFGIGYDVNQQLLTLLASHNGGIANFLGTNELFAQITNFYLTIRNPVLLNTRIQFTPPLISEVYPDTLPNLYKGTQMIVAGRYSEASLIHIALTGSAYGRPISYSYDVRMNDSTVASNQYVPKVWAKRKIETLLVRYYSVPPSSPIAIQLRTQIINISRAYGVSSPFTSFVPGGGGGIGVEEDPELQPAEFELAGNYPNPFNMSTTIPIKINVPYHGALEVRIYNMLGQLVRTLRLNVTGAGSYRVVWDGRADNGVALSSGMYVYVIDLKNTILSGKMSLLK